MGKDPELGPDSGSGADASGDEQLDAPDAPDVVPANAQDEGGDEEDVGRPTRARKPSRKVRDIVDSGGDGIVRSPKKDALV